MFIVIVNGEVRAPEPLGNRTILIAGDRIARVGDLDLAKLESIGLPVDVIDASGCIVAPGLIDPHEHLLGGSGEKGWSTQTPEIALREIVSAGITTVVGCLGTDTTTKTMPGLLAKAKAFNEEGITAFIWSGGYDVPPVTLTGTVRRDMLLVSEVIGAGEIAIADRRSTAPSLPELARIVKDAYVGGTLTGKAGLTHFHVGEESRGLADIRELLDTYGAQPEWLYPTHVERTESLLAEAAEISRRGVTVDVDTVEHDLAKSFRTFLDRGGDPQHFTASSDAGSSSPATLFEQVRSCVLEFGIDLGLILPCVTSNTARVLRLDRKGHLRDGADADVVVLRRDSLELVEAIARGKRLVKGGVLAFNERFLEDSERRIHLDGLKA